MQYPKDIASYIAMIDLFFFFFLKWNEMKWNETKRNETMRKLLFFKFTRFWIVVSSDCFNCFIDNFVVGGTG